MQCSRVCVFCLNPGAEREAAAVGEEGPAGEAHVGEGGLRALRHQLLRGAAAQRPDDGTDAAVVGQPRRLQDRPLLRRRLRAQACKCH